MKKLIFYSSITILLATLFLTPAGSAVYIVAYRSIAQTFTALQTFGAGLTVTGTFKRTDPLIKEVCATGCEFTTITSALAAITDASATKRYTVRILPGNYDETVTAKSYVSFSGTDKRACRIRGISSAGTFKLSSLTQATEISIDNLTIGGALPVTLSGTLSRPTNIMITNCIIGIIDGTESAAGKSVDGYFTGNGGRTITSIGNQFFTTYDAIRMGDDDSLVSVGDVFTVDDAGAGNATARWISTYENTAKPMPNIRVYGARVNINVANTTQTIAGVEVEFLTSAPTSGASISLNNVDMRITTTNASRTATTTCAQLITVPTNASASVLDLNEFKCSITATDSATVLTGMKITSDADHATWTTNWTGGSITLSGGATRYDVDDAETVAGFTFGLAGVRHSGSYTGAGTISAADTRLAAATTRLQIPAEADLVADTCTIGEIKPDSVTTRELCWCYNNGGTGRWACVSATTANGPTD